MNKKILLLALFSVLALPLVASAVGAATTMLSTIATDMTAIGGSIVIIGWVIAGILYLTSAGSPEKTGTAKKALVACVIGTALVVLAASGTSIIRNLFPGVF